MDEQYLYSVVDDEKCDLCGEVCAVLRVVARYRDDVDDARICRECIEKAFAEAAKLNEGRELL